MSLSFNFFRTKDNRKRTAKIEEPLCVTTVENRLRKNKTGSYIIKAARLRWNIFSQRCAVRFSADVLIGFEFNCSICVAKPQI